MHVGWLNRRSSAIDLEHYLVPFFRQSPSPAETNSRPRVAAGWLAVASQLVVFVALHDEFFVILTCVKLTIESYKKYYRIKILERFTRRIHYILYFLANIYSRASAADNGQAVWDFKASRKWTGSTWTYGYPFMRNNHPTPEKQRYLNYLHVEPQGDASATERSAHPRQWGINFKISRAIMNY